ncbi:LemA family protein [Geothrix sp. 21YS21S-2]|uniref:LemA family protein n=1 Tax=Geothrix sp. 21YS21S-2 TaxID=3068893 RepID=UPI0027B8E853|nr:LemA family protein [Geothrix sp. 21YS21S-2]
MGLGGKIALGCGGILVLFLVILGLSAVGSYNSLNSLGQGVDAQWGQVENVYQRRADLVPNLVATVKGAAAFEKDTFTAVTEARAKVGQINLGGKAPATPEALASFQKAQEGLGSALSRLMVVVEKYPDLKATQNFRELQAQLEGTENRIAVERMRFNQAAQAFNTKRNSFPTLLIAGFFGDRFRDKAYFKAQAGSETAPKVAF